MFKDAKDIVKQPTVMTMLLTSINPIALAIGIVGLAAYAGYRASSGRNAAKETVAKPLNKPLSNRPQAIAPAAGNGYPSRSTTVDGVSDEVLKREMIRQAMSELGKRSAAARARKKELILEEFDDETDSG